MPDASRHPGLGGVGRTSVAPTPTSVAASSCCSPTTTCGNPRRGAAGPACSVASATYRCEVPGPGPPRWGAAGDRRRASRQRGRQAAAGQPRPQRAHHGARRRGRPRRVRPQCQPCPRCGETVEARPVTGRRTLYWCPGCQVRLDQRPPREDTPTMDPHPAAQRFLDVRRGGCAGFAADTLARPCVRPGSASWSSPSTRRGWVLDRIPADFRPRISAILVSDDHSQDGTVGSGADTSSTPTSCSRSCASRNLGYGGNQKFGYRWAMEQVDVVVLLHGDGQYARAARRSSRSSPAMPRSSSFADARAGRRPRAACPPTS